MFKPGDRVMFVNSTSDGRGQKATVGPRGVYPNTINFGPSHWVDIIWDDTTPRCGHWPNSFIKLGECDIKYKPLPKIEVGKSLG